MSDADLIRRARDRADPAHHLRDSLALLFGDLADRLEQLTRPADRPPVGPGRETQVRDFARRRLLPGADRPPMVSGAIYECVVGYLQDLLTLLDHERAHGNLTACALQDLLAEDDRFGKGVQAGKAQALAAIEEAVRRARQSPAVNSSSGADNPYLDGLIGAEVIVRMLGADVRLPPHVVTYARMRSLEDALTRIGLYAREAGFAGFAGFVAGTAARALSEGGSS